MGGGSCAAALTVMVTVEVLTCPALSFAVSVNIYIPALSPVIVVIRFNGVVITHAGPDVFAQLTELIEFPPFAVAVPVSVIKPIGS